MAAVRAMRGFVILKKWTNQVVGLLVVHARERPHRFRSHVRIRIGHHCVDGGKPSGGDLRLNHTHHRKRPGPHGRRFMIEKQRSDQMLLVERFQEFDGIQNASFVGAGQFLNESLDCRQIRRRRSDVRRLDLPAC